MSKPLDCRGVTGNVGHHDFREHDTITLTRAEFEAVKAILEKSIDYAAAEEALAILAKYEVKDDNA